LRRTSVDAELRFPLPSERNAGLVADAKVDVFRLGEKTTVRLGFENADGDEIASRLEGGAHRIGSRVLDPCAAADGFAVNVDRV
jgi:hypothetical protein